MLTLQHMHLFGSDLSPQEWHIDTGNNAWVAMAFAHYAAASGSQCDAAAAREIMQKIVSETSCHASFGGFTGRMRTPHGGYRATEHNIDMFALGRMLGETGVMNEAPLLVGAGLFGTVWAASRRSSRAGGSSFLCIMSIKGRGCHIWPAQMS